MEDLIGGVIGGLLNFLTGVFGNVFNAQNIEATNASNERSVQRTNEANIRIARETNAANAGQAFASYVQSLPSTQINDMMNAGISRGAAINKIAGGGTYTAPVIQGATMQHSQKQAFQADTGAFQAAIDRLSSIPANVAQRKLQEQELESIKQRIFNEEQEEKRRQERHNYDMWQKQYGKDIATIADAFNSKIMRYAAENKVDLDKIDSKQKFIDAFDLANDKEWQSLPKIVQDKFFNDALGQARENRDIAADKREQQAAKDRHIKFLDDLKNSEVGRAMSHKQMNKLEAETEATWQHVDEYEEASEARQKENAARAARADFERISSLLGIAKADFKNSNFWYTDKDGNIQPTQVYLEKRGIAEAWDMIGTFFGKDLLQDILRGMVVIGK